MNEALVLALNLIRITLGNIFKVPNSMVELFVKVLNKMLFSAKGLLLWHHKNNNATNLMRLSVSASNSLKLYSLLAK